MLVKLDNIDSKITVMRNLLRTPISVLINKEEQDQASDFEKSTLSFAIGNRHIKIQ